MPRTLVALLLFCIRPAADACSAQSPTDLVDVFSGTSNSRWMMFPGPTLPFGMVKLSPDNQGNVWNGGYEYTVGSISGFSHLHGMSLAGVSYMPYVGRLRFGEEYGRYFPGEPDGPFGNMWTAGYRSRYDKASETGAPGYYRVDLLDAETRVELTATARCGLLRATFPEADAEARGRYLLLDFDPPTEEASVVTATRLTRHGPREIRGSITFRNSYVDETTVYFVSRFSADITGVDAWQWSPYAGGDTNFGTAWRRTCRVDTNVQSFSGGAGSGVVVGFGESPNGDHGREVLTSTALSFVSVENALLNFEAELAPLGNDFARVRAAAVEAWDALLGTIEVEGDDIERRKFYTNYYRAFTGKNLMSDANGEYLDMCETVRTVRAPAEGVYSSDALWGAQWDLFPLWTLAAPRYANAFANGLLELQRHGGWVPEAPVGLEYSPIMGAQHQNALLVSLHQKGLARFDAAAAFEMIRHDYTTPGVEHPCGGFAGNRHMAAYMADGYVAEETGAASNTVEYAFDDWCLGQFALSLKRADDYRRFDARAGNWRNLLDPETKYLRRRHRDGRWVVPFDPMRVGTEGNWNGPGYMEGNAWVYTWYVPHDLPGLVAALGRDTFNARLEEGFRRGYVDLGNQPNLQAPFLFNYAGKPWLTQRYTRMVAREYFRLSPFSAYRGEEDEGQMGALYCLLAMGLFEMQAGCGVAPYYDLSAPLLKRVTVRLDGDYYAGKTFVISTEGAGDYIQSMTLNGVALREPRLPHAAVAAGGELRVVLGERPNEAWWR